VPATLPNPDGISPHGMARIALISLN
jgi:hypothetical protein